MSIVSFQQRVSCRVAGEPSESEHAGWFPELRSKKPKLTVRKPSSDYPSHWLPDVSARRRAKASRVSR